MFSTVAGGFEFSRQLGRPVGPGQANWMGSAYSSVFLFLTCVTHCSLRFVLNLDVKANCLSSDNLDLHKVLSSSSVVGSEPYTDTKD